MKFKIACIQYSSRLGDVEYNLSQMAFWSERAAKQNVAVAVFPEACLTGYCPPQKMIKLALSFAGPLRERIIAIAKKNNILLVFGMPEKDGDQIFNSMIAVSPIGDVLGCYHKTHLWPTEYKWASPGDRFVTFETELAHFGMLLCYDTRFPEAARSLALQGVEVILIGSAWRATHAHEWRFCVQARALDNGVYIAGSDTLLDAKHHKCLGSSLIVGPSGQILTQADFGKECLIVAEIDPALLHAQRHDLPLLQHRRPELYME